MLRTVLSIMHISAVSALRTVLSIIHINYVINCVSKWVVSKNTQTPKRPNPKKTFGSYPFESCLQKYAFAHFVKLSI